MGYLTTITIYNDGSSLLIPNAQRLAEKLNDACHGRQIDSGQDYDGLGGFANLLTLQKPRHADDHTLYMHAGNTVIDVQDADSEWSVNQFIKEMEYHLKRLKKIKEEKNY